MHTSNSGGSSETEVKLFAVSPTGVPSGQIAVTTVTPVAKQPSASRKVRASLPVRNSGEPRGARR
jgi:primosomal replication protein N